MMLNSTKQRFLFFVLLTLATGFVLQACQNSSQAKRVPSPTRTQIAPTATPGNSADLPASRATSVISDEIQLNIYTHPSNHFKVGHPDNWEPFERPDGVIFVEPGDMAGYSIVFSDVGKSYSAQELNRYLVSYVAQNFAGEGSGFKAISQEQQVDGSIVAQFASNDLNLGRTISEVKVFQKDTIVFVLHHSATEEQWGASRSKLHALTESFTALDTSSAPDIQLDDEPPTWVLTGPENQEFGFFYASNWEILERGDDSISVVEPNNNMTFTAAKIAWPDAANDPKAAEKAALAHVEFLAQEFKDVRHLDPTEFPLDTSAGATIDFFYTADDGTMIAGSVIAAVHDGTMHKIVFTAPANPIELYDLALQWFNPMIRSFKFLSPEDFVAEEP